MALPNLLPPSIAPDFLLDGHSHLPDSLHDDFDVQQGEGRKRKVQTYAPRVVDVAWLLEPDEAAAVDAWLEGPLQVLHQPFTARIAPLGTDTGIYWAAQWIDPPHWEGLEFGRWRVTGSLFLTGEGSDVAPGPVALEVEYAFALDGTADVTIPADLEIEFGFALQSLTPIAIEYEFDLSEINNGAPADDLLVDLRWVLMGYPWAPGYTAEITDDEAAERSWIERGDPSWR